MAYKSIGDYGIIGDLHTIALVGMDGSIDWCCLPHFDSPSVFAAILDHKQGGYFKISPTIEGNQRQMYLSETNILLTRFFQEDGVGEITDFMPVESDAPGYIPKRHQIVRMVAVTRGQVRFRLECAPSFNYGRDPHTVLTRETNVIFRSQNAVLGLVSPIPIEAREGMAFAEFTLSQGQSLTFFIEYLEACGPETLLSTPESGEMAFRNTSAFWQR